MKTSHERALSPPPIMASTPSHCCQLVANVTLFPKAEDKVKDKAAFFKELYALNDTSDEEETSDLKAMFLSMPRQKQTLPSPTATQVETGDAAGITERAQAPTMHRSKPGPISVISPLPNERIMETPQNPLREKSRPRRLVSASTPSSKRAAPLEKNARTSLGKRKRKQPPLRLVPKERQIFRELTFFYIPNDDISPVRRARITKAREYGVTWSPEFSHLVTHIIVDEGIPYDYVLKVLGLPVVPAGVILVDELYALDCIQFRAVLNPDQRQYKAKGQPGVPKEKSSQLSRMSSPQASDGSLKIKPSQSKNGGWGYAPSRETTPPSQSSVERRSSTKGELLSSEQPSPIVWPSNISDTDPALREGDSQPVKSHSPGIPGEIGFKGDELDEIINEARTLHCPPLGEVENGYFFPEGDENDSNDSEDEVDTFRRPRATSRRQAYPTGFNQQSFSCMTGGTDETLSSNPNAHTISILKEMAEYYTRINDPWRPIAYRKAIATLRQQKTEITTAKEASKLLFIGQRLALKIEEIARTSRLRRLENAKIEPSDIIIQKFMGIYGVGFNQASKWFYAGYKTLEDLKTRAQLTDNQLLGIEHYDDFQTRIPRQEVTALGEIVKTAAFEIDPAVEIIIGGSYRRGATDSGDIDCIITKPNTECSSDIIGFLSKLVSHLRACNFLVAALAVPRSESGTKWHGCCVLPNSLKPIWRRIDLLLVPATELGAALIYFTGNDIFNRSIRLLASKKGMRLNQRGLYKDVMRGPGGVKITQGELVEGADEKKIFEALGVPWRPPEQRIC
jgi:DNA polymerase IV